MKKGIRLFATALSLSLLLNGMTGTAKQTKKVTVKQKKLSLQMGNKKKIVLKNKKKNAVYLFKSANKGIASVSKKGVVTGKKAGKTKITVWQKYKKKKKKIGQVFISVKISNKKVSSPAPTAQITANSSTSPTVSPTPTSTAANTPAPTATPIIAPTPTPIGPAGFEVPVGYDKANKENSSYYGKKETKTYYSTTTGKNRKVNIIVPAGYTTSKKYPVLYLLHGIGGDENEWMTGSPQYIIGNLLAKGAAKEMIVVIPNCRARASDAATNEYSLEHYAAFDNFINDLRDNLMPYVKQNYSIAEGRENTAIAGYSMGGRESLNIGLHMPETFGYIASFSPGYGVFSYEANGVKEEGLFTDDNFLLPDAYKDNTLLLINNGSSEGGGALTIGGRCHNDLTNHNIPHMFYVTPGGHEMKVWKHGLYNFVKRIF